MKYYAEYENNVLVSIGTTSNDSAVLDHELTEAEYNAILAEIRTKAELVDALYNGDITEEDLPEEYAEEVVRRVAERREEEAQHEEEEASMEEIARALEEIL